MKETRSPLLILLLSGIALYLFQILLINEFDLALIREALHHRRSIVFGLLLHALLAALIGAILNRLYVALSVLGTLALTVLACDLTKFYFLEAHLQPNDVFLLNDLFAILPSMIDMRLLALLVVVVLGVLLSAGVLLLRYPGATIYPRRIYRVFGLILPFSFAGLVLACYWFDWKEDRVKENQTGAVVFIPNFSNWRGDQKIIEVNGVTGYVIAKLIAAIPPKKLPENYSRETIANLLLVKELNKTLLTAGNKSDELPNIIVVMSESFWSISTHAGLRYQGASLHPTVDKLQVGNLLAPAFGGGTANTEFEFLTSLSYSFYDGSTPFITKLTQPIFAFPNFLRDQGYQTTAIHTFFRNNYNRPQAYRNLGFDNFLGIEDIALIMPDLLPPLDKSAFSKKQFPSDEALNQVILQQLKDQSKPQFVFAVSMQNHGRYADDRFADDTLPLAQGLSASSTQIINTYGTGITLSDQAFNNLIHALDQLPRETIVVFFGDHLPNLEGAYDELNYFSADNSGRSERKYSTPIALYSTRRDLSISVGDISPAALAPVLLTVADIALPPFYRYVHDFYQETPVMHPQFYLQRGGDYIYRSPRELAKFQNYALIGFDMLEGMQFSWQH